VRLVNWFSASFDHVALRRFNPFWSPPALLIVGHDPVLGMISSCNHL
jgi:hypothetical protein